MDKQSIGSELNSDLQEMLDHYQITKMLKEYCHGCDRLDATRMAGVYLEDSWDDHGAAKMPGRPYAAHATSELLRTTNMVSHQLGQTSIRVNKEEAGAETYFICTIKVPAKDGGQELVQMGGRYVDTLRREEGKWKIKKRICVRDWSITHPLPEDFMMGGPYVEGERSGDDPSFAVLGIRHSGQPSNRRG